MGSQWPDDVYKCTVLRRCCFVISPATDFAAAKERIRSVLGNPRTANAAGKVYPMSCCDVRFSDLIGAAGAVHIRNLQDRLDESAVLMVILDQQLSGNLSYALLKVLADESADQKDLPLASGVRLSLPSGSPRATVVVTSLDIFRAIPAENRNALLELYTVVDSRS